MSYTPQVGDRVRKITWPHPEYAEVLAIDGDEFFYRWPDGDHGIASLLETWIKVEPRPTIAAEQWGYVVVDSGLFYGSGSESSAYHDVRVETGHPAILARIVNGVVTDADGVPFDVEPRP